MTQRQLLDSPFEVILAICCFLLLKDVLAFEQTCRKARDVVAERQVWLSLLKRLDQCCAPDIPPHVDLDSLSTLELRDRIVTAVRIYENCLRGEARYVLRESFVPEIPRHIGDAVSLVDAGSEVKLAPGGRHLFVQLSDTVMQIYDLHRNNACVWSYTYQNKLTSRYKRSPNAFEMVRDGSIILLLSLKDVSERGEWSFQVHHLFPAENDVHELQSTLVYSIPTFLPFIGRVKLAGDLALVKGGKRLIVTNWRDGWYLELSCAEVPDSFIWELNVLQDTIIVLVRIGLRLPRWSITTILFHQLFSIYGNQGSGRTLSLDDPRFSSASFEFPTWPEATFMQPFHEKGVLITIIGKGNDRNRITRYEFLYDANSETQPAPVLLGKKEDTLSGQAVLSVICGCYMTRTKCGFRFRRLLDRPDAPYNLVKFGYKFDGGIFESTLTPVEHFQQGALYPEEYSSALGLTRDGKTIEIWYPE